MSDNVDGTVLSNKLKDFLTRKLNEKRTIIAKLKRKRKIIKVLYYSTTILSIVVSALLAAICTSMAVPPIAITILSLTSGILTGISTKFNFEDKNNQICREIDKINRLNQKLDYVISCNGNLSSAEYSQILSEFTTN